MLCNLIRSQNFLYQNNIASIEPDSTHRDPDAHKFTWGDAKLNWKVFRSIFLSFLNITLWHITLLGTDE